MRCGASALAPQWTSTAGALCRSERFTYGLGIARNHGEISARRLVGGGTPLLPIAQCAERNAISTGKVFLADPERTPDNLYLRRAFHAGKVGRRKRQVVRIACSGSLDLFRRHGPRTPAIH